MVDVAGWVPDEVMLKVRHGKGNKQRQVYLSERAITVLDDWLAVTRAGQLGTRVLLCYTGDNST
jgi:site-specific recombinase XerC